MSSSIAAAPPPPSRRPRLRLMSPRPHWPPSSRHDPARRRRCLALCRRRPPSSPLSAFQRRRSGLAPPAPVWPSPPSSCSPLPSRSSGPWLPLRPPSFSACLLLRCFVSPEAHTPGPCTSRRTTVRLFRLFRLLAYLNYACQTPCLSILLKLESIGVLLCRLHSTTCARAVVASTAFGRLRTPTEPHWPLA